MKTKFITATGALMALWLIPPTNAIAATCLTYDECATTAALRCIQYCCQTGNTGTEYTCPDDWSYNSTSGLCERDNTIGESDSTGWYIPDYGTCAATTSTYDCFKTSSTSSTTCLSVPLPTTCGGLIGGDLITDF